MVTPTKVQWDAGKIKSTTRESLKQENQETKNTAPFRDLFRTKNPRCGLKSKNEAFDRRRLWSRGSWKNKRHVFFLGRASYRVVVEEKPLDAEVHFFRKKKLGFWIVVGRKRLPSLKLT